MRLVFKVLLFLAAAVFAAPVFAGGFGLPVTEPGPTVTTEQTTPEPAPDAAVAAPGSKEVRSGEHDATRKPLIIKN